MTNLSSTTSIADAFTEFLIGDIPFRLTAYDGCRAGPEDAEYGLNLLNERGLNYILSAPGDLGLSRAYVSGDLEVVGSHPGDPYEALMAIKGGAKGLKFRLPTPGEAFGLVRALGVSNLKPPPVPPQEHLPRWRRLMEGFLHSPERDAEVIAKHYDVSNRFYELVLGPSMAYTCAVFPTEDATLEEAQANKFDLVCRKLGLKPGMRLLDVGCGWGGMVAHAVRHYGVEAIGVTLSREQAQWAQKNIVALGLADRAEIRHLDYRDVTETGFDAISSIGLTEHIGARNVPGYFRFLAGK